jgi:hypothetical protein
LCFTFIRQIFVVKLNDEINRTKVYRTANGLQEMASRLFDDDADDLREIVDSLLSGVPLSRVPEEIHSRLLVPLSAAKNEAIVAGNRSAVKRLQSMIHELQLNPGRSAPPSRISSRSQSTFVTARSLKGTTSDDMTVIIDDLLDGRDVATVDGGSLLRLVGAMKERKRLAIAEGDYRQSQQLENLIQAGNSRYFEITYHGVQNSRLTALKVQLMKANEDLQAAEEFWARAREEHDQEYASSLESLEADQDRQLTDFDSSFPEALPSKYLKWSPQLLQMREQEKHLVLSKRYDDAILVRERADALEQEELEQQRQKLIRAFQVQRQQLIDTHKVQRSCFETNWERKTDRFEAERDRDISVLKRTIGNFEIRIGELENQTEVVTFGVIRSGPKSPLRPLSMNRITNQGSPPAMNARVRTITASKVARKPRVRRI